MNFKNEDFLTPVPPTRRMVYDAFAFFFGAVMIPFLRRYMPLGNTFRTDMSTMLLKLLGSPAVIGIRSDAAWASRILDGVVGKDIATGITDTESVVVHGSEFCEKTHCSGSTSTAVEPAWEVL